MLKKEQEEKLKYFLESVNQTVHAAAPEVLNPLYDLGLVIIEPNSKVTADDVFFLFPRSRAELLEYKNNKHEETFIQKMAEAIEEKKWVLIKLASDPEHQLINQLRMLSEENVMQLLDYKGQEIYNLRLPLESRVVVIVERAFLENKVSYPHFIDIFGPVISL